MGRKGTYLGGSTLIQAHPLATSAWRENQRPAAKEKPVKAVVKPRKKRKRLAPKPETDPLEIARTEQMRKLRKKRSKGIQPTFQVERRPVPGRRSNSN
jgi:hypothetical protein